ncbi:MAG: aldehyde oxidase [Deltaproteobacteria bacterium]|nr:MAG: aldehyde oxidase [Deltaproteobacteria bacterium]
MAEYDRFKVVNKSPRRVDAMKLALGKGTFTDDLTPPGMLHVKMLGSPHAHARILSIDTTEAEAMPDVHCVLNMYNVKAIPHTTAGQGFPEPSPWDALCFPEKVRFVGDRVCAVAAETEAAALRALETIKVEYEVLPAILSPEEAVAEGAVKIHEHPEPTGISKPEMNLACTLGASVGDVEAGFAASDRVIERTYRIGYAQQSPIEPHIAVTWLDEDERLTVRVATQVPFHSRRILAQVLEIPVSRIRVIKPRIGGGFGVKQEVLLEDVPALVTLRTGRPARWALTRPEELVSARTRHPSILTMKAGVNDDGTLVALSMEVLGNSGAYGAHALTVVSCTGGKALPLYKAEHYRFDARVAYTNLPVGGAFRGYGAPQGFYAVEILMDEIAHELGMDPIALREKNMIGSGDDNPLAVALGEGGEGFPQRIRSCGLPQCIEIGREKIGWERRKSFDKTGTKRRGIGMVALMQGSGIPGVDMASSFIKLNDDGSFNLLTGATDIGTGSDTVLSQIAAEELGVTVDDIIIYTADTDLTPFDTGAYASSTTYISGTSVKKAAAGVRRQIVAAAADIWKCEADGLVAANKQVKHPDGRTLSYGDICRSTLYHHNQHQIMDHASHLSYECPPPFSAHFCEVEVDVETGEIKVLNYVAAVDCGVAIHPTAAEGQTEGGVQMGLGYALSERYLFDDKGVMQNASFADYKIFSALDMPELEAVLVPTYEPSGPFGAKSVSEIPINGPAPLLSNAVFDAIGVRFREAPITPEMIWRALREEG